MMLLLITFWHVHLILIYSLSCLSRHVFVLLIFVILSLSWFKEQMFVDCFMKHFFVLPK